MQILLPLKHSLRFGNCFVPPFTHCRSLNIKEILQFSSHFLQLYREETLQEEKETILCALAAVKNETLHAEVLKFALTVCVKNVLSQILFCIHCLNGATFFSLFSG